MQEYIIEDIEDIEQLEDFQDEYVYDMEVDGTHMFFANNILVHNSIYVEFGRLVNYFNIPDDKACQWVLTLWKEGVEPYLSKKYQEYSDFYNCDENLQVWELEKIIRTGLIYAKKHNALEVGWDDSGVFYNPMEKVSYTGLEVVQGSTPAYPKKCQKDMIEYVLRHYSTSNEKPEYGVLVSMLKKYKAQMPLQRPDDISKTQSLGDYQKFVLSDKDTVSLGLHTPIHVKAAAIANHLLYKNNKYMSKYNIIRSGDKVKFYYTTNNNFEVFGFHPNEYPIEYAPPINYDEQFDKLILTPLNSLIGKVLGYNELNVTLCYSESLW